MAHGWAGWKPHSGAMVLFWAAMFLTREVLCLQNKHLGIPRFPLDKVGLVSVPPVPAKGKLPGVSDRATIILAARVDFTTTWGLAWTLGVSGAMVSIATEDCGGPLTRFPVSADGGMTSRTLISSPRAVILYPAHQ